MASLFKVVIHEPELLMSQEAHHVPFSFLLGILQVSARWAHWQPVSTLADEQTSVWRPLSIFVRSWGQDAAPLNAWVITPVVVGLVFPGLWPQGSFLLRLHLQQRSSCGDTCRGRYWQYRHGYSASSDARRHENLALLLYGTFLFLCEITDLLRLGLFLLWLTCTIMTLSFKFRLEFKQMAMVLQSPVSCTLLIWHGLR